ncbi:2-amino-4-hydroxy-6-hydroxymethyldihydropteridine diphosphokinase [Candidatus Williamhamiltonella defendens]|uniref:2-amino-4-hydroxy-6- hydroxymethyldihydropteridine diphosphokinase n=1 Tax=Candidatus Williamhamiltonella defendens TaxID=138072 RepID=UPI00130D4F03|nr:2-amino-4-hydroxy-6-hydroxymethyldihydropteridine diphosphokinase [Candidatus Hamiltonella defensa]
MSNTRVYIGLGSNLSKPKKQIKSAITALTRLSDRPGTVKISAFYQTKPLGSQDQPNYLNAAVSLDTSLSPETLLDHTQLIELNHGRTREKNRWGPRIIDLDILLYGDQIISTPRLRVPQYGIKNRVFVLYPLLDIAPDLIFPDGESLAQCLVKVNKKDLLDICQISPSIP